MMSDSFKCFRFYWNPYLNGTNQSKVPLGPECGADVRLRLDSTSSNFRCSQSMGPKRKRCESNGADSSLEHASLALGLGRSLSSSEISMGSSETACTITSVKESTDEDSSFDHGFKFQLHLGNDNTYSPMKHSKDASEETAVKPVFDLQLSLSTGISESILINSVKVADEEGSASSELKLNNCFHAKQNITSFSPFPTELVKKGPVTCTSGKIHSQQRATCNKNCKFQGCLKGARGASGLCISHGGGRRCQKYGCQKGAEGRTVYCKAHGGGRRCQHLGCTKSAEGRTEYCIAHGGGLRCSNEGCTRAARGKSGLCIRHGGGKRCQRENCSRSAEGFSGLCISHGGGKRCQFPDCTKGAQGSTMFCKAHGGGRRCTVLGCTKGAEGSTPYCKCHGGGKRCSFQGDGLCSKSVHGGTLFCVAHGGGKRCTFLDCSKSARGRTDYCVRHGGGKRCKLEGCGKSAQGSTDFCKAHGGGKRCSWGHPGSGYSAGTPCDRFVRRNVSLCGVHSPMVQDSCTHGGGTLRPPTSVHQPARIKHDLIEEEVISLRPKSCGGSFGLSSEDTIRLLHLPMNGHQPFAALPEGRVHGGRLMEILSSCPDVGKSSSSWDLAVIVERNMPYAMAHEWV